jgi:hypothetical protein
MKPQEYSVVQLSDDVWIVEVWLPFIQGHQPSIRQTLSITKNGEFIFNDTQDRLPYNFNSEYHVGNENEASYCTGGESIRQEKVNALDINEACDKFFGIRGLKYRLTIENS